MIRDAGERIRAIEAYARERAGEGLDKRLASIEDPQERWKTIAATCDLTEEECRILRTLCRERRAAWLRMIRLNRQLKQPMNNTEYRALWNVLLLPDVLKRRRDGQHIDDDCLEQEAAYMLQVLRWPTDISPVAVEPDVIAHIWFTIGSQWGEENADKELQRYIEISPDSRLFWDGLMAIADRCRAEQRSLPERLSTWLEEVREGQYKRPKKVTGGYPHANESRDTWLANAVSQLQMRGMTEAKALEAVAKTVNKRLSRTPKSSGYENMCPDAVKKAIRNVPKEPVPTFISWIWDLEYRRIAKLREKNQKKLESTGLA
ncbi:MAG: hypothetical protein OXC09_09925 [Truepera sp.]|nr:hypothetical protein [Truepera sp.]